MGADKAVDSLRLDRALNATANAILTKTGSSTPLEWDMDDGFADAVDDIQTGTDVSDTTLTADKAASGYYFYNSSGTKIQGSLVERAGQTIHPASYGWTISSGILTGSLSIMGVVCTNLTADNIKSGVTVKIGDSSDDDCVTSVTGTYSGGAQLKIATGTGGTSVDVSSAGWTIQDITDINNINCSAVFCSFIAANTFLKGAMYVGYMGDNEFYVHATGVNRNPATGIRIDAKFTFTKNGNNILTMQLASCDLIYGKTRSAFSVDGVNKWTLAGGIGITM